MNSSSRHSSLEQKLAAFTSPADMLRNSPAGQYVFPVPAEFSNWRDEQEAWAKAAILFDQSYHMTDLYVEGPDTHRLLSDLGVNSFSTFGRNRAKQYVVCSPDGFVIGDSVLLGLEQDKVMIIGRPPTTNWVQFHAETGGYNVQASRDERSVVNPRQRHTYRFQVQGPNAWKILEKVNGGPLRDIRFFHMGEINIAGRKVRFLRHGMVGAPGLEIWGPVEDRELIRDTLLGEGAEFGIKPAGARAYSTTATESGWIPSPLPAIYAGPDLKAYRSWLPADGFEGNASLGGSFYSNRVEDYYLTPWDLGYGSLVKFDHDFIGRDALERKAREPHRTKVTLKWERDDVLKIFASMYEQDRFRHLEMPASFYSLHPYDKVLVDGKLVGLSTYSAYTANARSWLSLAMVNEEVSRPGTSVEIVWGEENGGSAKPAIERHLQTTIRATVAPSPYMDVVRATYRTVKS